MDYFMWQTNACELASDISRSRHHLFASAQCLGQTFEHAARLSDDLANELCRPSADTVLRQVQAAVERTGAVAVFVATDSDPMIEQLSRLLGSKVGVVLLYYTHNMIKI